MKSLLAWAWLAAGLIGIVNTGSAAECGTVKISNMNWQTAELIAEIDRIMLEAMGCEVELVAGSTLTTLHSMMDNGSPDIAPESWVDSIGEPLDRAVDEGRLSYTGQVFSDGGIEGWWIPGYLADANPHIKTIEDALLHADLFSGPGGQNGGVVHNCPEEWKCHIANANLFEAYRAGEKGFTLVEAVTAADLDESIIRAHENKRGWLGYYWAPSAMVGRYGMVRLEPGVAYDKIEWERCTSVAECDDPKKNTWPVAPVMTVVTRDLVERSPDALGYLRKRSWSNDQLGRIANWMSENQDTGKAGAVHFLRTYEEQWTVWVSPEIADKVRQAVM